MIAAMMKPHDPNKKKMMKSAGLFLNECYSSMDEYLYRMKKSKIVSTENSPK